MSPLQSGSAPTRTGSRCRKIGHAAMLASVAVFLGLLSTANRNPAAAAPTRATPSAYRATTSRAARQSAVRSIPFQQLDESARAKVRSVLSDVAVFRRMPTKVIDCDPNLYLFLVRHPDVVVNIWEVLKISRLQLRQVGPETYRVAESSGTAAEVEFLHRSHDVHVIYAEGTYEGPLFARPVRGRALMVLKTGYIRQANGRFYITTRLDTFVRVDHGGAELLTRTFHPLVGKTADSNFVQSLAFFGSLSRTAEVNGPGVQRLAGKLAHVQPEHRVRLAELAGNISRKTTASSAGKTSRPVEVVSRTEAKRKE